MKKYAINESVIFEIGNRRVKIKSFKGHPTYGIVYEFYGKSGFYDCSLIKPINKNRSPLKKRSI